MRSKDPVARRLSSLRKLSGLTLKQVCRRADTWPLSVPILCMAERGQRPLSAEAAAAVEAVLIRRLRIVARSIAEKLPMRPSPKKPPQEIVDGKTLAAGGSRARN
jgi:transcriptional regulator with XRE-family HTH domain